MRNRSRLAKKLSRISLTGLLAVGSAGCMLSDPNDPNYMFHKQTQNPNYSRQQDQQRYQEQAPGGVFTGQGVMWSMIGAYKGNPAATDLGSNLISAGAALNNRGTNVTINNVSEPNVSRGDSYPKVQSYPIAHYEQDGDGSVYLVTEFSQNHSRRDLVRRPTQIRQPKEVTIEEIMREANRLHQPQETLLNNQSLVFDSKAEIGDNQFGFYIWNDEDLDNEFDFRKDKVMPNAESNKFPKNKNILIGGAYRTEILPVPSVRVIDSNFKVRGESPGIWSGLTQNGTDKKYNSTLVPFLAGELEPGDYTVIFSQDKRDFQMVPFSVVLEDKVVNAGE